MFECRNLSISDIEFIYKNYMINDFPKDELKPLSMIKKSISKNQYVCLGIYSHEELSGYAFFVCLDKFCLLDYFAILSDRRGTGIGSSFLELLKNEMSEFDIVKSIHVMKSLKHIQVFIKVFFLQQHTKNSSIYMNSNL